MGSSLCVGDEREEVPLLTGQTLGKLDQKDLPVHTLLRFLRLL